MSTLLMGCFFLHLLVYLPVLFGEVARFMLKKICKQKAKVIYLVFDKTDSPSIKDCERDKRADDDRDIAYQITGPDQKRPGNWLKAYVKISLRSL